MTKPVDRADESHSAGPADSEASDTAIVSSSLVDSEFTTAAGEVPSRDESDPVAASFSPATITRWVLMVEGALVLMAAAGALLWGFHDPAQPISKWFTPVGLVRIVEGGVLAVPLLMLVLGVLPRLAAMQDFFESTRELVVPLFSGLHLWQVAVISLAAGVGEEVFFRWCLQGGLTQWLPVWVAVVLSATVFGICHWINATYFLLTAGLGLCLGGIYLWAGPLAAIACHAVYDFVAILVLVKKA